MPFPTTTPSLEQSKDRGLQDAFDSLYVRSVESLDPAISGAFQMDSTDGDREVYELKTDTDQWRIWNRGDERVITTFGTLRKTVVVDDYELTLALHENDKNDDRSGRKAQEHIESAADQAADLLDRQFASLITETADTKTLKRINNCADGFALFSSSHAEGSNIVTGLGTDTIEQIQKSFWLYFKTFQDKRMIKKTTERMFNGTEVRSAKHLLFFPLAKEELFRKSFDQDSILAFITQPGVAAAAETNYVKKFFQNVVLVPYHRITGADWFIRTDMPGKSKKPFIHLQRQGPRLLTRTVQNSDHGFMTKVEIWGWDKREGVDNLNWNLIHKINN